MKAGRRCFWTGEGGIWEDQVRRGWGQQRPGSAYMGLLRFAPAKIGGVDPRSSIGVVVA